MLNVSVYPRGIIRGGEHSKSFPQSHQMGDSSLSRALTVESLILCAGAVRKQGGQSKLGRFYSNQNKPRRTKHIMGFHAGECVWGVMWAGTRGDLEMA